MPEGQEYLYGPLLGGLRPLKQRWSILTEPWTQTLGHYALVVGVYMGAEGRGFGLKRQDKGGEALQTHQYLLVQLPSRWNRPGAKRNTSIFTARAHMAGSEGRFWPFLAYIWPDLSVSVG